MKLKWITTGTVLLLIAGTASASHGRGYGHTYARVVDVEPIVRRVVVRNPQRECWEEVEYRSAYPSNVAGTTIAGGVIGAAIGRQFGGGRGRDGLTLLGAIAGSAVANEHARRNEARRGGDRVVAVPVERCAVTSHAVTEDYVEGYWVTYRYRGRLQRIRTHQHPGSRIRLEVHARPVRYYR